jgi:carbohydrate kinase (thermoresistant glucokinase family)
MGANLETIVMMVVVVMGVAGSGKSTVGPLLAQALGGDFAEGDKFHPAANVAKMKSGTPLDDADRKPWLEAMAAAIRDWSTKDRPTVLACSALKRSYRAILAGGSREVRFVFLKGEEGVIAARMAKRHDHFMPPSLLKSQFATLEEPEDAIIADIRAEPAAIVAAVLPRLGVVAQSA